MATTRTFIAVEVSDLVRSRAAALISRLRSCDVKVSWVSPESMHITLKFLGDQPDEAVAAICQAVRSGAAGVPPFEFRCQAAGAFPNTGRPRTLWLGVTDGVAEFQALHAAVDAALARERFPKERQKFRPHLTIGRVRSAGPTLQPLSHALESLHDFDGGPTMVDEVTVFSSELSPAGPIHEVLARAPLAGS
ncbi:MAG: RNA 2',3'-cyclic phosphodiesterase [Pirellulaceae bacterium]